MDMWVRKQIITLVFCGGFERGGREGRVMKSSTTLWRGQKKHTKKIRGEHVNASLSQQISSAHPPPLPHW